MKKTKNIVNLFNENTKDVFEEKNLIPIKTLFVEKKDGLDRPTLNMIDGPLQVLHAEVGNLEFLDKSAADSRYCLSFVNIFASKIYVYSMKSRKLVATKMESFYKKLGDK